MTRVLRSLAVRFPLLVGAIVLLVAVVTGRLIEREVGAILLREAADDLSSGTERVAAMLGAAAPATRQRLAALSTDATLQRALAAPLRSESTLREWALQRADSDLAVVRLIGADAALRASQVLMPGADSVLWAVRAARANRLLTDSVTIGAIVAIADTIPGFVVTVPIHGGAGEHLGWYVEARRARARGVADVRQLMQADRLLVGTVGENVWTDLERIAVGPVQPLDDPAPQRVQRHDGVPVLGVHRAVLGTPWVVWVEDTEARILAPLRAFLTRLWSAIIVVGLLGAAASWALGRYVGRRITMVARELDRTLAAHPTAAAHTNDRGDELRALERSYEALEERVAERRRLDATLMQSQKLEAVGRLAGGVAHDFNNLLTVITNYGELVRERLDPASPEAQDLHEVLRASEMASGLTRQLLAFSRRRLGDEEIVDVNALVQRTERMLARLIPSNVARSVVLSDGLPQVRADVVQVEQVLMNLVVNAVDAMPDGGRLTLRTSHEGGEVRIAVEDTGIGMDEETKARIFDPFFTTKSPGKGTGLGLATVHGIITDAGGRIEVESDIGRGTSMQVVLPAAPPAPATSARRSLPITAAATSTGHVLLVEDDDATRGVFLRLLQHTGHRVQAYGSAEEALAWFDEGGAQAPPDVLVSDVMLPGLSGVALAERLRAQMPALPVVLMSGYADLEDRYPKPLDPRPVILEKPFSAQELERAISRAVGRAAAR